MPADIESIAVVLNSEQKHGRSTRPLPWWGAGQSFADYVEATMTDDEALQRSGLDWEVHKSQNYHYNPAGLLVPSEGSFAAVRDTDGKTLAGHVGRIYEHFQNREMIEFGSTLVDHFDAHWDTVGSLRGGSTVFASLRLDDVLTNLGIDGLASSPFGIDLEKTDAYLLLRNSHDGSSALSSWIVFIRVVCANTEQLAIKGAKASYKIRHTGTLDARVDEARSALDLVPAYAKAYKETAEKMIEADVTEADLDSFVKSLVPVDPAARTHVAQQEKQDRLRAHILGTDTVPQDYKLTQWGLLQGSTEFFEHIDEGKFRKATPVGERRMLNVLGGGAADKARSKALALLS